MKVAKTFFYITIIFYIFISCFVCSASTKDSGYYTKNGTPYLIWQPQGEEAKNRTAFVCSVRNSLEDVYVQSSRSCEQWTVENFKEYMFINYGTCIYDESSIKKSDYCSLINGQLFALSDASQRKILELHHLYWNNNFLKFICNFYEYESYVLKLHEEFAESSFLDRVGKWCTGRYYSGLKDILAEQAYCIKQEKKQRARYLALKKQQDEKQKIEKQKEHDSIRAYQHAMEMQCGQQLEQEQDLYKDLICSEYIPKEYYDAQTEAVKELRKKVVWSHKQYKVSHEAHKIIHKYSLDVKIIEELDGHQLQHVIHQEFIDIIERTAENAKIISDDCQETVMQFADVGLVANRSAVCSTALKAAEFCWGVLYAAGQGIVLGVQRAVAPIVHPLQTADDIGHAAKMLGHIFYTLSKDLCLYINCSSILDCADGLKYLLDDARLTPSGRAALSEAIEKFQLDAEHSKVLWNAHYEHRKQQIKNLAAAVQEQLSHMTVNDIVREGVALVVDAKASAALLTAMNSVLKTAGKQVAQQIKKIKKKKAPLPVAVASEGLHFSIVDQAFGAAERSLAIVVSEFHERTKACLHAISGYTLLEHELPQLRKMFDGARKGFNEFSNKYIKLPYEHILLPEFVQTRRGFGFIGFHHDFLNAFEKNNLIKFADKIYNDFGCYSAKLHWDGKFIKESTFFPACWSREKVVAKIYEAYDDFIAKGAKAILNPDGKYYIRGFTIERVEVEMIFTRKGKLISAYPVIKDLL